MEIEEKVNVLLMSQQLWQIARLTTMGESVGSITHELNNLLAAVSLRVESLLTQVSADDPRRRGLEVIKREVGRMGDLVANLLQFSRCGQPQISTVDVCKEIDNSLSLFHYRLRQHRIAVVRDFAPELPMVHADRQQLHQLFLNLYSNAVDAMLKQGGALKIHVGLDEEGKRIIIEISDTGGGISSEDLPKVMEPFFTTRPEGQRTGLGLPICQHIVQDHDGTFNILSEGVPGKGTTARIELPVPGVWNGQFLKEA